MSFFEYFTTLILKSWVTNFSDEIRNPIFSIDDSDNEGTVDNQFSVFGFSCYCQGND